MIFLKWTISARKLFQWFRICCKIGTNLFATEAYQRFASSRLCEFVHKQARKLGSCDSYLRNLKLSLTDSLTHWPTDERWPHHWLPPRPFFKNTAIEQSERLVTLEACDQSDEETWPDQQKNNDKDKDNEKDKDNDKWKTPPKNNPRDLWPLRHCSHFWQLRTTISTFTLTLE